MVVKRVRTREKRRRFSHQASGPATPYEQGLLTIRSASERIIRREPYDQEPNRIVATMRSIGLLTRKLTPMTAPNAKRNAGRLADRMRTNPVVIDPQASLDQARDMFANYRFRHLPVVTCNEVVGIISDRDMRLATGLRPDKERLKGTHGQTIPGAAKVSEIMRGPVHCMTDEDQLEDAALVMLRESIGAIPICQDGQLVGIVTETDVLKAYKESCDGGSNNRDDAVRIHMHSPVDTIHSGMKVDAALDVMDHRLGHLIVTDDGCMTGIVSERDLLCGLSRELVQDERAQDEGYFAETDLFVQSIMSNPVLSVRENDSLSFAASLMIKNKFSAVPVLNAGGSVVGLLTQRDILEEFVASS